MAWFLVVQMALTSLALGLALWVSILFELGAVR